MTYKYLKQHFFLPKLSQNLINFVAKSRTVVIRVVHPGLRILIYFTHPGSRGQKGTGSATLLLVKLFWPMNNDGYLVGRCRGQQYPTVGHPDREADRHHRHQVCRQNLQLLLQVKIFAFVRHLKLVRSRDFRNLGSLWFRLLLGHKEVPATSPTGSYPLKYLHLCAIYLYRRIRSREARKHTDPDPQHWCRQ